MTYKLNKEAIMPIVFKDGYHFNENSCTPLRFDRFSTLQEAATFAVLLRAFGIAKVKHVGPLSDEDKLTLSYSGDTIVGISACTHGVWYHSEKCQIKEVLKRLDNFDLYADYVRSQQSKDKFGAFLENVFKLHQPEVNKAAFQTAMLSSFSSSKGVSNGD